MVFSSFLTLLRSAEQNHNLPRLEAHQVQVGTLRLLSTEVITFKLVVIIKRIGKC